MDVKFLENIVLAVLNECTRCGIESEEAVRLVSFFNAFSLTLSLGKEYFLYFYRFCNSILFAMTPEHPSHLILNDIFHTNKKIGKMESEVTTQ